MTETIAKHDTRHGSAYDRGSADAYYRRSFDPHYYLGATGSSPKITQEFMTEEQIDAYAAGYNEQVESGDFKIWD